MLILRFLNQFLLIIIVFAKRYSYLKTKFIANEEFLMFLIAIAASLGILGEASIIFNDKSTQRT